MASVAATSQGESFIGRTVIVTGGAGSIGKAVAVAFAKAGADVVVNDIACDEDLSGSTKLLAHDVVAEIKSHGGSAIADTHSVTDAQAIVKTAIDGFGRVDIIVNNAGIMALGPLEEQTTESFRHVFEVNALAPMELVRLAWPYFKQQSFGRVINFTSDSVFGMPGASPYVLSRGAMMGVTRTLALEGAACNIKVNAVAPTAYSRMTEPLISMLPEDQQQAMKRIYTGDSNVPLILALGHENCDTTGQILSTGGYSVGKMVLGCVDAENGCQTIASVRDHLPNLYEQGRRSTEPMSIQEYMAFRASAGS